MTRRKASWWLILATSLWLFTACTAFLNGSSWGRVAPAQDMQGMMQRHMAPIPPAYASLRNPVTADADSLARGKAIYTNNCLACHGEQGWGDGPAAAMLKPPPAPLAHTAQMLSDTYLFYRISEGGNQAPFNSAMPAFKPTPGETQRWDVINYVRSLNPNRMDGNNNRMEGGMVNCMMGGGMMAWVLLGLLLFIGLIAAIVLAIVWLARRSNGSAPAGESPGDILKRRYAQGEINSEQYEAMKRQLNER